jgi:outer membrane protein TolC
MAFALERTYSLKAQGLTLPTSPGVAPIPDPIGPVDQVDARLSVSQTLFDPASWLRLRSAGNGVSASRAETDAAAEAAARLAALAYLRIARANALLGARQADLDLARHLTELAEAQVRAGTAVEIDIIRARAQEATARSGLLQAQNQSARAKIDLARALGLDPATPLIPADTLDGAMGSSAAPTEPEAAVALALVHRPELVAERARNERAQVDKRAIQAERLPHFDLGADYGLSGQHFGGPVTTGQVILQATLPLFDGARREQRVAEQGAIVLEAEVRARELERQVAAEVRTALLDLSSGLDQQDVALEQLRLAEDEMAQARDRFASGVAGSIEVITAQASLNRARDAVIEARTAIAGARMTLAWAAGLARTIR